MCVVTHPNVEVTRVSGQWHCAGGSRSLSLVVPDIAATVLAFAATGTTKKELLEEFGRSHEIFHILDHLIESGLLLRHANETEIPQRCPISELLSIYAPTTRRSTYLDYSDDNAVSVDRSRMLEFARDDPCPPSVESFKSNFEISLPLVAVDGCEFGPEAILYWCFGVQLVSSLHDSFTALRKAVPSNGARHVFDAYLGLPVDNQMATCGGSFYFNCRRNSLVLLEDSYRRWEEPTILICAVYDRMQWRYRHSVTYKDIWFDLGHILDVCAEVCKSLGISCEHQLFPQLAHPNELMKEVVLAVTFPDPTALRVKKTLESTS